MLQFILKVLLFEYKNILVVTSTKQRQSCAQFSNMIILENISYRTRHTYVMHPEHCIQIVCALIQPIKKKKAIINWYFTIAKKNHLLCSCIPHCHKVELATIMAHSPQPQNIFILNRK